MITIDVYIANLNKKSKWTGGQYKTKLGQNALFNFFIANCYQNFTYKQKLLFLKKELPFLGLCKYQLSEIICILPMII